MDEKAQRDITPHPEELKPGKRQTRTPEDRKKQQDHHRKPQEDAGATKKAQGVQNIPPRAGKGQNGRNKRQGDGKKGPDTPTMGRDRPHRAIIQGTGGRQRPQDKAGRTTGREAIQTIRRGQRDARGAAGAARRRRESWSGSSCGTYSLRAA